MALESLETLNFSAETDVWSLGNVFDAFLLHGQYLRRWSQFTRRIYCINQLFDSN